MQNEEVEGSHVSAEGAKWPLAALRRRGMYKEEAGRQKPVVRRKKKGRK